MYDSTPVELVYASEVYSDINPVHLEIAGMNKDFGGLRIIAVIEPGHDPYAMWRGLLDFLREEAISA